MCCRPAVRAVQSRAPRAERARAGRIARERSRRIATERSEGARAVRSSSGVVSVGDARRESYWDEVAESAGVTRRLREFAANNWGEHWRKADADAIERRLLNALVEDRRDDLADRRDDQAGEPPL